MQRKNQRAVVRDLEIIARDIDALRREFLDLGDQRMRIEHDAVADHRKLSRTMPDGSKDSL